MVDMEVIDFDESEVWNEVCIESIKYKNKNFDEWCDLLALPAFDVQNLEEVEFANKEAMRLTELISSNCSKTKGTFYLAKAAYTNAMHLAKNKIIEEVEQSGVKRLPSQDNLERMALDKCLKEWRVMLKSEIIYEFWQTHSYKLNQIHTRLTSLNIIKNIESKQLVI